MNIFEGVEIDLFQAIFGFSINTTLGWVILIGIAILLSFMSIETKRKRRKRSYYSNQYRNRVSYAYKPSKAERQYYRHVSKRYQPKVRFKRPRIRMK